MLDLSWKELGQIAWFGTLVTVVGTLLGHLLKDWLLVRVFEKWKTRRAAAASLSSLAEPMFQSACDLLTRLKEIHQDFPPGYLQSKWLESPSSYLKTNADTDPHYCHYKFVSTLYRVCAFFAWVERFRQEVASVANHESKRIERIDAALNQIRSDFADGHLNSYDDWEEWADGLIFREEIRAIGECMLCPLPEKGVVGYATFCNQIDKRQNAKWLNLCYQFFADLRGDRDFRKDRIYRLIAHLYELLDALEKNHGSKHVLAGREEYKLESEVAEAQP